VWGLWGRLKLGIRQLLADSSGPDRGRHALYSTRNVNMKCLSIYLFIFTQGLAPVQTTTIPDDDTRRRYPLVELFFAFSGVVSLALLKACTRLRKLDLRGCDSELKNQVEDLKPTHSETARHAGACSRSAW
jgi:hypothetical protein